MIKKLLSITSLAFTVLGVSSTASAVECIVNTTAGEIAVSAGDNAITTHLGFESVTALSVFLNKRNCRVRLARTNRAGDPGRTVRDTIALNFTWQGDASFVTNPPSFSTVSEVRCKCDP